MRVLVVNAGSSSLKFRFLGPGDALLASDDLAPGDGEQALRGVADRAGPIDAVGHRIVHGGADFRGPAVVDGDVLARIEALTPLAPLHQPAAVAALRAAMAAVPGVPHVACFDTAYHADLPAAAATYAVPRSWRERWGIRRYGFHGLSHAYAARRAAELLGAEAEAVEVITCHLGAGASLAAIRAGRSVDTTMGFTPLEGLVMATRSGTIDPGILLFLQQHARLGVEELGEALERGSGLLGLAGAADMRDVLAAAAGGRADAILARDVYVHRLVAGIASMRPALDRLDALVFTGGVGEHAAEIRARAVAALAHLGLALDPAANERGVGDRDIGLRGPGDASRVLVIASREDLEIAHQVRSLVPA